MFAHRKLFLLLKVIELVPSLDLANLNIIEFKYPWTEKDYLKSKKTAFLIFSLNSLLIDVYNWLGRKYTTTTLNYLSVHNQQ